jgi:hypothetical protein
MWEIIPWKFPFGNFGRPSLQYNANFTGVSPWHEACIRDPRALDLYTSAP